jgi:hypothetical protein
MATLMKERQMTDPPCIASAPVATLLTRLGVVFVAKPFNTVRPLDTVAAARLPIT